jgi:hypothetical protein
MRARNVRGEEEVKRHSTRNEGCEEQVTRKRGTRKRDRTRAREVHETIVFFFPEAKYMLYPNSR